MHRVHTSIYQLKVKCTNVYFEHIQVIFEINTKHIGAISQVYRSFIIAIEIIILLVIFYLINNTHNKQDKIIIIIWLT